MAGDLTPIALAAVIGAAVTGLELITTEYPRTSTFALRSPWFYGFVVIYSIIAGGAYAILPLVGDQFSVAGLGIANPWVQAAIIGFSIKAVLHIRIFTVSRGPGDQLPVGLETLVQLFEPWLLSGLDLDHYFRELKFVRPRAALLPDVPTAKATAISNIPARFKPAVRAALQADINRETTREGVIIVYMGYCGINLTKSTFP
jgi:hypothetical protein